MYNIDMNNIHVPVDFLPKFPVERVSDPAGIGPFLYKQVQCCQAVHFLVILPQVWKFPQH